MCHIYVYEHICVGESGIHVSPHLCETWVRSTNVSVHLPPCQRQFPGFIPLYQAR